MKTSSNIISSISTQPQFRLLARHLCYNKFLALLPPRFRASIAYISIKDSTLYIAITHPGAKMELNYNKDLFKSILAMLDREDNSCSFPPIVNVTTYIPKYSLNKQEERIDTVPRYDEKATGEFDMPIDDEELTLAFENIKEYLLQQIITNLPSSAGVYQYFDKNDKLLYIGKAKNLKNRVKSYWRFTPSFSPNHTYPFIKTTKDAGRSSYT